MAQHFLLSAKARTLSLKAIYRLSDDEAFEAFKEIRFAEHGGEPFCPDCGGVDPYFISTRRKWKCRACLRNFSATSGTIFASRKMAFVDLLAAICIFINAAKGISALQFSRDLDCQYKTAFVLAHKLREAMASGNETRMLSGVVEVDGAYFGGHVRPENRREDRKDRRRSENKDRDRRVVVVARQRGGRTLPFVTKREGDGVALIRKHVSLGTELHADEAAHWDTLEASTRPTGSTTARPTASTASAPIRPKATSPACAGWCRASTTTSATATCTSTRARPLGARTTTGSTTAGWRS